MSTIALITRAYRYCENSASIRGTYAKLKIISVSFFSFFLTACALKPADALFLSAESYTFKAMRIDTSHSQIIGFHAPRTKSNYLNIYLAGDGRPWISGIKKAKNPSGRHPYIMQLMHLDTSPSIYLSRPCYGHRIMPEKCNADWWTSHRYSDSVIAIMNEAIDQIKQDFEVDFFNIIGFSGGGSLAVLITAKRQDINALVTIAANLDHRAWTDFFKYDPLLGSLNAVEKFPLSERISRWHLLGASDTHVPTETSLEAAKKDIGANITVYPDFTHDCCWEKVWPSMAQKLYLVLQ